MVFIVSNQHNYSCVYISVVHDDRNLIMENLTKLAMVLEEFVAMKNEVV